MVTVAVEAGLTSKVCSLPWSSSCRFTLTTSTASAKMTRLPVRVSAAETTGQRSSRNEKPNNGQGRGEGEPRRVRQHIAVQAAHHTADAHDAALHHNRHTD